MLKMNINKKCNHYTVTNNFYIKIYSQILKTSLNTVVFLPYRKNT